MFRVSQNQAYHFGGPHNKHSSILGSLLGSPYFGKIPLTMTANFCQCRTRVYAATRVTVASSGLFRIRELF